VLLLLIAIGLTLLGSLGGLLLASTLLLFNDRIRLSLIPGLISYAVGTLLGVALLALLPNALETLPATRVLGTLLAGILLFFVLEKLVIWRHCHTEECVTHPSAAPLVLIGDAFHNFVDGAVVGAAVVSSIPLGVGTAIAVAAHEIPQEVGDFAVLLGSGYTRRRALMLNIISGLSAVGGTLTALLALDWVPEVLPYVLSIASASFLYIAMADLIPDLNRGRMDARAIRQILLISAGIITVVMVEWMLDVGS
jgi:zinc and cadmium transporter